MPAKIARSAPRPPFGIPEVSVAVRSSRLSCSKAEKARIFMADRQSSGESRLSARFRPSIQPNSESACVNSASNVFAKDRIRRIPFKEKLIKIGAKVVSHGRYVAFQMAEVAIPRQMFQEILRLIAELRPQPPPASA